MNRILVAVLAVFIGFIVSVPDADARRFGGGRSSGLQRDSGAFKRDAARPAPAPSQANPAQAAKPAGGASRWLGPLAGLAAGIGLAALLSHLGMGEGFATMVMLLLLVMAGFFLFRMLFRKPQTPIANRVQFAGPANPSAAPNTVAPLGPIGGGSQALPRATGQVPNDFDADGFQRQAKVNFMRMQAAHDAANIEDIREFTTPEMFAEVRLQMQEAGGQPQHTDVVTLEAEVLDVVEEANRYVVSTRFSGTIRESRDAAAVPFDEVWHLVKPIRGSTGWVVAGIQQMQ